MPEITAAATFCATLVDEWARAGVRNAVLSPGSRSTPLALALAEDEHITVHVHHDERAAGFLALGLGAATGTPAVVATTSGTAAVELHPAVVEAHQAGIPMLVCTADRPPELLDVGAPQTIDQTHLYGRAVRWFAAPGVPDDRHASTWRSLAARAVMEATGRACGPVHLNLAFRDPLVGGPGPLPGARPDAAAWHERAHGKERLDDQQLDQILERIVDRRGVLMAGPGPVGDHVHSVAERLGWPVLTVPRSAAWIDGATSVTRADALLRDTDFANHHRPEVVLRFGGVFTSKVIESWLAEHGVPEIAVLPPETFPDPGRRVALALGTSPTWLSGALLERLTEPRPVDAGAWLDGWQAAQAAAQKAVVDTLARHPEPTEPAIARDVCAAVPGAGALVVSSSMPIRDLEWYADPRHDIRIFANRGANGIDGVVSSAVGVALAGERRPTVCLVGDVAFLHDTNALLGLTARPIDLTIVVVDNDGGGIFSFLPQASDLAHDRFETLFGTPHGLDLTALAAAHGIEAHLLDTQADVGRAVRESTVVGGSRVLIARTERAANVALHDEIHAAVAAALS